LGRAGGTGESLKHEPVRNGHLPQIIQPMKIPKTTAAPNMTTVPKMSGT